uniref:PHD finger protein 14 (inferred by orthology to a human protein) n=1 Tax=Nippostrongylus brasiliensis TaxID=27835 RepID=A0A0N4Y8Q9_NIPBR
MYHTELVSKTYGAHLQEFTRVPGETIPFLCPGFSTQFFEYLGHRENVVMAAEESKLQSVNESKLAMKADLDAQIAKLKQNEQNFETGKNRSEQRRELAVAFHRALMKLGAKKIAAHCPISKDNNSINGKTPNQSVKGSPALNSEPKLKREVSINVCKECGKANDQHLMVGCDSCHQYYHIVCLDPPLEKVPKKVNCEWHCADCCDNSDEEENQEEVVENSNDEVVNRKLRQRRDSIKAKRLAAAENQSRPPLPPKRNRSEHLNGHKVNGFAAVFCQLVRATLLDSFQAHKTQNGQVEEELGEDCLIILDDEELEL